MDQDLMASSDPSTGRESRRAGLLKQAVSGVKWNGVALVARVLFHMITIAILARLLAPAEFGLVGMSLVVTGFARFFADFGVSNAIIHRQDATREQLSSLYWLNVTCGVFLCLLLLAATPLIVAFYGEPALTPVLQWSALSLVVIAIGQQFSSLLRRELRFRELSLIATAQAACYAAAAVFLAIIGSGVMSIVWGSLLATAASTALLVVVAMRSHWMPTFHFRRGDLEGFASFGLYQMGERAIGHLANNVDYLIIGRFLGAEPLGYYIIAYNLMRVPLNYLNPVITSVAFPTFARVQEDNDALRLGYKKLLHYLSSFTLPIYAGLGSVTSVFVVVVYGAQWLPAVPVIQVFCLLGAISSLGHPIGSLLLAKGRADIGFALSIVSLIGLSASNWIGSHWGITGVAASSLVFTLVVLVPIDFFLRRRLIQMTVRDFWESVQRSCLACLGLILAVAACQKALPTMEPAFRLMLLIICGGGAWSCLIALFDRKLLKDVAGYAGLGPPERFLARN